MKKRWIILVVLTLSLFINIVNAEVQLFDGEVFSGDTIAIKGVNISFRFDDPYAYLLVNFPERRVIVPKGECKLKNQFNVCFDKVEFSHLNQTYKRKVHKAFVRIYSIVADVNMGRSFSTDEILLEEIIHAIIHINNTGNLDATNVTYKEKMSTDFEVINVSGCKLDGDYIEWKGDLDKFQKVVCRYTLKGKKTTSYNSEAVINYHNSLEYISESSQKTLIIKDYQLQINTNISSSNLHVGNLTNLVISLTNLDYEKIKVKSFSMPIPDGFVIIDSDPKLFNRNLQWNGNLEPNETIIFNLTLQAQHTGKFKFNPKAEYTLRKLFKINNQTFPVSVSAKDFNLNFKVLKTEVSPGDELEVVIELVNLNKEVDFRNVTLNISSLLLDSPIIKNIPILPRMEKRVIRESITVKLVEQNSVPLNLEVTHSWFEEKFTKKASGLVHITTNDTKETNLTLNEAPVVKENLSKENTSKEPSIPNVKKAKSNFPLYMGIFALEVIIAFLLIRAIIKERKNRNPENNKIKKNKNSSKIKKQVKRRKLTKKK